MYLYKELLINLIQEEPHIYSKQTRRFHFAGMFCEMMALLNKSIPTTNRHDRNSNRSTLIARDFMELVNADDGSHRSVSYYADRLYYSPKYLSSTIKQVTGKSPLQIINEHAIQEIKFKLKHSTLSMKEMADFFDFPNPSFFGKFVKAHTGMAPLQYRLSEKKEE
jgi:AraC-like DNA-binding protein